MTEVTERKKKHRRDDGGREEDKKRSKLKKRTDKGSSSDELDEKRHKKKSSKHRGDDLEKEERRRKRRKEREERREERGSKHGSKHQNGKKKSGKHENSKKSKREFLAEDNEVDEEETSSSEGSDSQDGSKPASSESPLDVLSDMLQRFKGLSTDLSQLLVVLDSGQAVDLAGLADPKLRSSLVCLFKSLSLRRSPLGLFSLRPGQTPTLTTLSPLLKVSNTSNGANGSTRDCTNDLGESGASQHTESASRRTDVSAAAAAVDSEHQRASSATQEGRHSDGPQGVSVAASNDIWPGNPMEVSDQTERLNEENRPPIGPAMPESRKAETATRPIIGPQMPPHLMPQHDRGEAEASPLDDERAAAEEKAMLQEEAEMRARAAAVQARDNEGNEAAGPQSPPKRMVGPIMPSRELLEAAAKMTEAQQALEDAEEEMANEPLIGPVPVAAKREADNATESERFDQVERITGVDLTAYEILDVKPETSNAEMKKRYWKLSLMVHPDKCSHPKAQEAFTSINQALKDLQDPTKRSVIDAKIAEKKEKAEYEVELKAIREAAQWRRLRGEEIPGDKELLDGPAKPVERGTWMTELPPERQARQATTNTFFSRKEVSSRGDTSDWTDSPAERAQKAKQLYLEAYQQAMLGGGTSGSLTASAAQEKESMEKQKDAKTAALMDMYNAKKRASSLVEAHLAGKETERKTKKKEKKVREQKGKGLEGGMEKGKGEGEKEAWEENHPWKPWDRDTDLGGGRQPVKLDKDKMAGGLTSRFGGGDRKFL
eukprot:TRINITY_DN33360_c0_g1_i1.p1 TRINITY_DN33360_c0_g1~~TRINITY_DN33360_c0_g1_i1.p1  ORF type:complete len:774 (-),score=191.64 TRINITY_DN33360_c0_g1_i1:148-2469(-)